MNILILGANSDLAGCLATQFAKQGSCTLVLASRDMELLEKKAADMQIRTGVVCQARYFDALDYPSHSDFYQGLDPRPDGVIVAFGCLGNQKEAEQDFQKASHIFNTNFMGAVSILEIIAADFERRRQGFIIGISSVAGIRGRKSNYHYGASKAALTVFLSGLRNRLDPAGVSVLTVFPGFIHTKMTDGLGLPGLLTTRPEIVARRIHDAFRKKQDIVYTPGWWKWIMRVISLIPERVFKKLNL
jgi:short-subunit dehydrogenase